MSEETNNFDFFELMNSMRVIYNQYKDDNNMLIQISNFIKYEFPDIILEMKEENKPTMKENNNEYIKSFLYDSDVRYYYIKGCDKYIKYDNCDYKEIKEDEIWQNIYTDIHNQDKRLDNSYVKTEIINRIKKENNLFETIPESETIQKIIEYFTPFLFKNKIETKHYLCVLGDAILSKESPNLFFFTGKSNNFNTFIKNRCKENWSNVDIDKNFKYKYKLQDYKNIRLIYFSDLVSNTNYWENFINDNLFNLVSVACHYSNVYKNSDNYIKAQEKTISDKILLLVDKNSDDILNMFIKTMLETTSVETDKISKNDMWYLWRMYTKQKELPNIISQQDFEKLLSKKLTFKKTNYFKIKSESLGYVNEYKKFWKENFKKSNINYPEYELSEINMLYRNWLVEKNNEKLYIDETKMKNIMNMYPSDFNFDSKLSDTMETPNKQELKKMERDLSCARIHFKDKKIVRFVYTKLWDKIQDLMDFLFHIIHHTSVKNKDISFINLYKKYCHFIQKNRNIKKYIVSKNYFINSLKKLFIPKDYIVNTIILKSAWDDLLGPDGDGLIFLPQNPVR
tara:strand:+ start:229 stop:1929 length:1701 start_codon:yes stop_codon:yes gene_type:complete